MLPEICEAIIDALDLHVFVETGTDMAESVATVARWFARRDPSFGRITDDFATGVRAYNRGSPLIKYPVFEESQDCIHQIYSIDVCDAAYRDVKDLLERNRNVHLIKSDSAAFLRDFVTTDVARAARILFFLDAHWGKYWPLRDELREIMRLDRYAVVIDDFFVPGKSNPSRPHGHFGFDFFGGVVLDWAYVRDLFHDAEVRVFYPSRANRDDRGSVFLFKGYEAEELGRLDGLGLVAVDKEDPAHTRPVRLPPWAYLDTRYLVKKIVPMGLLRRLVRGYQKLRHTSNRTDLPAKDKGVSREHGR